MTLKVQCSNQYECSFSYDNYSASSILYSLRVFASNRLTLLNEFDKCHKEIMVAQWLEHWVLVLEVLGSIPVLATLFHAPLASLAEIMSM